MMRRAWRGLLLWLGMQACLAAAGTRLAVWSDPARQDLAALLVAELSSPGTDAAYEVLGRDELSLVMAEQGRAGLDAASAARAGRLLGAAGVAWLDEVKIDGAAKLVLRLSAVESGLVVGWRIDDAAPPELARWAAQAARQLEAWRPKLATTRETARAVSLLNLRASGVSVAGATREQALTALLGQALASGPHLWVLERWRLDDLALETVLAGQAEDGFWQGAALVDGSFTEFGGQLTLTLRLRVAGGSEERWTATGRDAGRLLADVADEVARRLGTEPIGKTWDRAAEAREFLDEARWAERQNLHGKVVEAVEAAITLGEDGPEAQRMRYLAHARRLWGLGHTLMRLPRGRDGDSWPMIPRLAPPEREKLERARQALAFFNDFRASEAGREYGARHGGWPRHSPLVRPLTLAESDTMELLNVAAQLLQRGYYSRGADAATEAELAALRRDARAVFEREFAALGLRPQPRPPESALPVLEWRDWYEETTVNTLLLTGFAQGAWWSERLSDHQQFARRLLGEDFVGEPDLFGRLIRLISPFRLEAWEVDWATRDGSAARASWERAAQEWMTADNAGVALAGAFQLLALNSPFPRTPPWLEGWPGTQPSRFGPPEEDDGRVVAGLGFFGRHVDALAGGRLPGPYVDHALELLPEGVPEPVLKAVRVAWAERLVSWWAQGEGPVGGEAALMDGRLARLKFTAEQKAQLHAAREKRTGARPAVGATPVLAPLQGPEVRQQKLDLTHAWIVPEARSLEVRETYEPGWRPNIRWLERDGGRVRVISEVVGELRSRTVRLTEIDLATFREREVGTWKIEDVWGGDLVPAHAMAGRWVFSVEKGELWRRDPGTGEAAQVALPMRVDGPIWALGQQLYATWQDGGIVRVEAESGAWEILADSRRRPAQGALDDCQVYHVERIWRGADGAPRAALISRRYVYDEAARAWRLESGSPHANLPDFGYQRRECLEWLQGAELAATSHYGDSELQRLLDDVDRSGKSRWRGRRVEVHLLGEHRPPAPQRQDLVGIFHLFGGMAKGEAVWALYYSHSQKQWSPRLVWLPPLGKEIAAVELRMPDAWMDYMTRQTRGSAYAGLGGGHARLSVGPEGLVFYAVGGAGWWFVPTAELATVGVEVE